MKNRAFTLIEILATLTIIVLLAGIIVYGINDWKIDANIKRVIAFEQEVSSRLGNGLLAGWDFNEDTGDIYDMGRFGHTLSSYGISRQNAGCIDGACIEFTDNSWINGGNLNSMDFKTFYVWVKTAETDIPYLITKRSVGTEQCGSFDLYIASKKPGIRIYSADNTSVSLVATSSTVSDVEINDNEWHLICASIKDRNISIYVDGKNRGNKSCFADSFGGGSHNLYFGGYDAGSANSDFWIDNVMLFEDSIID